MSKLNYTLEKYIKESLRNPSLQNQHLSGAGATHEFEEKLKNYFGKKFAISFSNCSTALLALCISLDLRRSEIITSPFNWGGSISPFLLFHNKAVFADTDYYSFNLDSSRLTERITPKTKAVLSVDYNGLPVDSKAIKDFCVLNNLIYISDSAQSFGAFRDEKPAGYFADYTVLSFGPGKSLFGGEGGAIVTDNKEIYEKIIWHSQHPIRQKKVFGLSSFNEYSPINGRLNPLSAILLNESFKNFSKRIKSYQKKCFELICNLETEGFISRPQELKNFYNSSYYKLQYLAAKRPEIPVIANYLKKSKYKFTVEKESPKMMNPYYHPTDQIRYSKVKKSSKSLYHDLNILYLRPIIS